MMKIFGNTFCFFKELSKNKGIEIQLTLQWNFCTWYKIEFQNRTKCHHAGTQFTIELLKSVYFHVLIHDFRHWDYENNRFCIYD